MKLRTLLDQAQGVLAHASGWSPMTPPEHPDSGELALKRVMTALLGASATNDIIRKFTSSSLTMTFVAQKDSIFSRWYTKNRLQARIDQ